MDERVEVNRRRWEEMAALHETTYFDGEGRSTTNSRRSSSKSFGDIVGQRVCHLQCHIGGNSIALAHLGATVVGVDFSDVALELAAATRAATWPRRPCAVRVLDGRRRDRRDRRRLRRRVHVVGRAVLAPEHRDVGPGRARLLAGGWLYVADTHPYAAALRWSDYPYGGGVGVFDEDQGDYTDLDAQFEHPEAWNWNHGIGEIVTALAAAGLRIDWLHEHPTVAWHLGDPEHLVQRADGMWEVPGSTLPLSFSLRATKE